MNTLASLHPGALAIINEVRAEGALMHRLAALGLRAGNQLLVLRQARFGGPIHVRIGTTELYLRRADACHVEVALSDVMQPVSTGGSRPVVSIESPRA